ncbi:MAG: hypothetical protein KKH37_07160 [Alphaproteobacteria bacterium]|nr:hypothetical protein [Alphaproteobacteria bacterium]
MFRISLGVAALALAASGTLAQNTNENASQNTSQNGPEQPREARVGREGAEQRDGIGPEERRGDGRDARDEPAGADERSRPAVDLRPLHDDQPEARRVVDGILSSREQSEARRPPQPAAGRAEAAPRSDSRAATGLSDLFSRQGTERVLQRMVSGPLDRSVRMLARCPPGLAKTGGCQPAGQSRSPASQRDSLLGRAYSPLLFGLTGFDPGRYRYRDGYLMQLAEDSGVAGYIPLLGGALAAGNIWPGSYGTTSVPAYLVDFYNLGQPGSYRYADSTLYRLDPQSAAIQSVAALLTDEEVAVGEPMPAGYDVYNVPYPYQGRYANSPEAAYRYVDGYVYRLDPQTRLVSDAIDLLT